MSKPLNVLMPLQVERAKPKEKPYKLSDGGGLFLFVSPAGARSWRYAFRFGGRAQLLTLGKYPDISLKRARKDHKEARQALAEGRNPALLKQQNKERSPETGTFKSLSEQWYTQYQAERSQSWKENARRWLDDRVYPAFGSKPIGEVKPADVLQVLKSMEREKVVKSAEYVRQMVSQIFDYAIRNLWATFNPAQSLAGVVVLPKHKPHPHLTEKELPDFLAKVDAHPKDSVRLAVKLLLLTFVRKSELTNATWSEVDMDRAEWRIPAIRMKNKVEHIVPLSPQALECFAELKKLSNGSEYVFPSPIKRNAPISRTLLGMVFDEFNAGISPHGIRSTASSILNERSGFAGDVIEVQLSHVERNQIRRAYNRAEYMESRAKLMAWWANYLDNAKIGNVVTLPRRA